MLSVALDGIRSWSTQILVLLEDVVDLLRDVGLNIPLEVGIVPYSFHCGSEHIFKVDVKVPEHVVDAMQCVLD